MTDKEEELEETPAGSDGSKPARVLPTNLSLGAQETASSPWPSPPEEAREDTPAPKAFGALEEAAAAWDGGDVGEASGVADEVPRVAGGTPALLWAARSRRISGEKNQSSRARSNGACGKLTHGMCRANAESRMSAFPGEASRSKAEMAARTGSGSTEAEARMPATELT